MTTGFPPPGSFFLRHIPDLGGRFISAAQAFVRGGSYWTHAGLVLDRGQIIQAQPGGAVILPVSVLADARPLLVSDDPIQRWMSRWRLGPKGDPLDQRVEGRRRDAVVAEARKLEGVGYSYLDYPVLGLAELAHAHKDNRVLGMVANGLRGYVQRSGHMICSALVDAAYLNAGIHLFSDGRLPGDVTPEDLAEYAQSKP